MIYYAKWRVKTITNNVEINTFINKNRKLNENVNTVTFLSRLSPAELNDHTVFIMNSLVQLQSVSLTMLKHDWTKRPLSSSSSLTSSSSSSAQVGL